ncbi:MAG: hypothetical protein CSA58_03725 [Micrococcales bacterium]|nr:MAG: hypothetical protein CSB46_07395 [Micrococcales bacterium]PIE27531.1 MAG: hypothetical protein CSA58_03725 [Micrococcales bacterium]
MTWLSVWLVAVGTADLVRALDRPNGRREAVLAGCAVLVVTGVLTGLTAIPDVIALALSAIPLALWVRYSGRTIADGRRPTIALMCLLGTVTGLLAFDGFASPVGGLLERWKTWAGLPMLDTVSPDRILLVLGLLLVNLATGNVLVQLMLVTMGATRPTDRTGDARRPSEELRGGRLLGPMERIFIFGLGLTGEMTAASMVIAAKGLLRFPQLQQESRQAAQAAHDDHPNVTEYFLIGSFVSWLVALVSLAMAG